MEAQIFNYSIWIKETDPVKLKEELTDKLKKAKFGILNFNDYNFKPFGYSALWLLSESHLAVHTFPEHNKTYVELSSCVKEQFDLFIKLF